MDKIQISPREIGAVIFDMDGVITDTATIHAAAWKQMFDEYLRKRAERHGEQFQPFDADLDYHRYVDGKPRYDGVQSFLESRDISLPYGNWGDKPDQETICGLGNRKNQYFLQRLKKQSVKVYESSIAFIKQLGASNIQTAVISASCNAETVLEVAGVRDLFNVKVDGVDSIKRQLKGKPDPAIFLEAAKQLKVKPEKTAIVEDSLAGVEAGRHGKFKLVVGLDRANQSEELKKRGADIVVQDLSQIEIQQIRPRRPVKRRQTINSLPSALERKDKILERLREKTPAIFLDYDGTLTPIVEDPKDATLPDKTKKVIKRLTEHYSVAIISGRDLSDVQNMIGIGDIAYAGSHGFDIVGPGGRYRNQKMGKPFLPMLKRAEAELREAIRDIQGARIEHKRFAIAVHYRQVDSSDVSTLKQRFDNISSHYPELRKSTGKKVIELRPNIDWDKGKALFYLLETLYTDSGRILPLYIGDDITDEDAFRAIGERGIAIAVGSEKRETAAHYMLQDTEDVAKFLQELAARAEREVSEGIWVIDYEGFNPEQEGLREALCTLGNGYFATRGAAPESTADGIHYPGTYVDG
jgi:alpha,alpha-trehalase